MRNKRVFLPLLLAVLLLVCLCPVRAAASEVGEIYKKSGAEGIYDSLDQETQALLSQMGVEQGEPLSSGEGEGLLQTLSQLLREKLAAPLKGMAALLSVVVLSRLAVVFEEGGDTVILAAALACAAVLTAPLLELIQAAEQAIDSACAFLGAGVPVYAALMAASGSGGAGGAYSTLALTAGSLIPILSSAVLLPLLHAFLMLALASPLCQSRFDHLISSLYGFAKWLLVFSVTLFSGLLSVQTMLGAQIDAASSKAVKLIASSAIPIVGGAFGDAVAAIQNSVQIVKSGAGAFGILAALCIFAPTFLQAALWLGVCLVCQAAAGLFDASRLAALFGACGSVARMLLAVLASVCAVAVVCVAMVLLVKGSLT